MITETGASCSLAPRLLIDTDPGIDDALALILALGSPGTSVEAITTVAGNVTVECASRNLARILAVTSPSPAPLVGIGARGPRAGTLVTATHVFGEDGLGGIDRLREPDGRPTFPEAPQAWHPAGAAELIVSCARRWGASLTIVALGPLTNLALALDRDAAALAGIGRLVVMGGAVAVGGNVTATAEFNIFVDPESAARVFDAGLPLTLVPLDATRQVVWSARDVASLAAVPGPIACFARHLGERGLALAEGPGIEMHDPLAMAVALDPSLVQTLRLPVAVETAGAMTRGMTVVDRRRPSPARPRLPSDDPIRGACDVVLGVDVGRFFRMFEQALWARSA
jgi:purine nucleosidase/pyrimidine-specific ribonucleoside hydrolase